MDFYLTLTPLLIAIIALYISYNQYKVNRDKLRLDLFEKRFSVFSGTRILLTVVLQKGDLSLEDLFGYRASIAERSFLFDKDIEEYLKEIDKRALKLLTTNKMLRNDNADRKELSDADKKKRSDACDIIHEELTWLTDQLPLLNEKFSPYMKFK